MLKTIKNFPNYKIDELGNIYSKYKPHTGKLDTVYHKLKNTLDKGTGYFIVMLYNDTGRKKRSIHRLLAETFIKNPDPKNYIHINHKDGNKQNNSLDNLEWCSPKQNAKHAFDLGLLENNFKKQRKAILQLDEDFNIIAEYISIHDAGRITGIAWQNISKVLRGERPRAGKYRWKYK